MVYRSISIFMLNAKQNRILIRESKTNKQTIIRQMGKITSKIVNCFQKQSYSPLSILITQNQRLLEKLGVVSKKAKQIIRLIEKHGGSAKICGAGGIKKGSGMILIYHPNLKKITPLLHQKGLKPINIKLGQKGVKIEKS